MARRPVPSIRWRGPSKAEEPPVNEIDDAVNAAFASFHAAAGLEGVSPLFRQALATARTGTISAARRAARSKKKRQTKVKFAVADKFCSLRQRIGKYYLAGDDSNSSQINLRIELLESEITDKLLSIVGGWHA